MSTPNPCAVALAASILLASAAAAQTPSSAARLVFPPVVDGDGETPGGVRRITLRDAQTLAAQTANPLARLGQLQVEAATQHRLGVTALYFPNISGQFDNLHFNKPPGELLSAPRPFAGGTLSVPVNIISQDSTAVNFVAVQPITPIFTVRQAVKIARADENIAKAKAGMPVEDRASLVEKTYFDLLVAERELAGARTEGRRVQAATRISTGQQTDALRVARSWLIADGTVKALTSSLNEMLGLPSGTRLELVPPELLVEHISLQDASAQAAAVNVDVIEAEQTAVKARAGAAIAKLEYLPSVAVIGGYAHQSALNVVLPEDFAYVGVIATYTLFDSGKRERTVRERGAQVQAAELAVQLNKAKAAATVKSSYLELERARELAQLARAMAPAPRVINASYVQGADDADPAHVRMEAEVLRAELEYRQAYARVRSLMGR